MELTDSALIDLLIKAAATQKPNSHRARTTRSAIKATYQAPVAKRRSRRCACGACATCQDEARWERIFLEKFADPNYYQQPLRRSSSLNW